MSTAIAAKAASAHSASVSACSVIHSGMTAPRCQSRSHTLGATVFACSTPRPRGSPVIRKSGLAPLSVSLIAVERLALLDRPLRSLLGDRHANGRLEPAAAAEYRVLRLIREFDTALDQVELEPG